MNIGGFQKNSLIDFPETIACIVFTQGCNFVCPYCHNPDLIASPLQKAGDLYDENLIFKFLEHRKGLIQGVVITGGEPTLQKDLLSFCHRVKDLGYKLKIDTNGTRPRVLEHLFKDGLVDFMSMDIKTSVENYHLVLPGPFDTAKIFESARILMDSAPAYEFRTTCSRPFVSHKILDDIGKMIKGASTYILQTCSRNVTVLEPGFLKTDGNFFSDVEMRDLQRTIDPYVCRSIVR